MTIRTSTGGLLASICKSMPQSLREHLTDRLTACFEEGALKDLDTAQCAGGEHIFQALHFSWYNRHCTEVSGSPLFIYFS